MDWFILVLVATFAALVGYLVGFLMGFSMNTFDSNLYKLEKQHSEFYKKQSDRIFDHWEDLIKKDATEISNVTNTLRTLSLKHNELVDGVMTMQNNIYKEIEGIKSNGNTGKDG